MSAKDDFELVRAACHIAEPFMKVDPIEAFSRLFTPRPLRELIAKKVKFAFIKTATGEWMPIKIQAKKAYKATTLDETAIPILTPDDMGVSDPCPPRDWFGV